MDKTGLKNAEPEIFSSVAEFLNSLLPLTSFHCIRNCIFWARDVNIKDQSENRRKRLHFFATPNNSTFAFGFCVCNHASSTTPLQHKVKFKKFSLSTYPLLKKLETSDHSCYMLPFYKPNKKLFCGTSPFGQFRNKKTSFECTVSKSIFFGQNMLVRQHEVHWVQF